MQAPISIVAGLPVHDFHIPTALSVTTPSVNDPSTTSSSIPSSSIPAQYSSTTPTSSSLSSSPSATTTTANANTLLSSSTTTVIPNDNPNELADEVSVQGSDNNIEQLLTTNEEPVDDRTKYGEKRR